jgi:23S rRNA (pseudouridine1915-N3)-methyltransferase
MRIVIAAVGRVKQGPERELLDRYLKRAAAAGKPLALIGFDVLELPESRAAAAAARKAEEGKALLGAVPEGAMVVLDERGKSVTSGTFAQQLLRWRDDGRNAVSFLIGGADGLDPAPVAKADLLLSLSALTWPHQLVRVMLAEQLYRATTILSGHPYHRE